MFTFSFAIKLVYHDIDQDIDQNHDNKSLTSTLQLDPGDPPITLEKKGDRVIHVFSSGHLNREAAAEQLSHIFLKIKLALLELKIPHYDWFSFNGEQRLATQSIDNLFEKNGIPVQSYKPRIYEVTNKIPHWPAAKAAKKCSISQIVNHITSEKNYGNEAAKINNLSISELEALNVLGLALAANHAKPKLILAMTAIEVLIDREPVSSQIANGLDALKEKICDVAEEEDIREQIHKILDNAKIESISKAGKRLVRQLLGNKEAKKFYDLYDIRSKLVHGNHQSLTVDLTDADEIEKHANDGFNLAFNLIKSHIKKHSH